MTRITLFAVLASFCLLAQTPKLRAHKVTVEQKEGVAYVTPASEGEDEDRLALVAGSETFRNGTIELEVSGKPGAGASTTARGFVGVAFRAAADGSRFECIYLRPTNGRAEDQVRRNHSVQYISYPGYPWAKLRKEFPEKYESYADLAPGEWTKVRIEVNGTKARLYVSGNAQPTLLVNDLKQTETAGAVALWVGPGTEARFRNLVITPR
jgi:hypothetical protein